MTIDAFEQRDREIGERVQHVDADERDLHQSRDGRREHDCRQ